jgi:hypothetical protein
MSCSIYAVTSTADHPGLDSEERLICGEQWRDRGRPLHLLADLQRNRQISEDWNWITVWRLPFSQSSSPSLPSSEDSATCLDRFSTIRLAVSPGKGSSSSSSFLVVPVSLLRALLGPFGLGETDGLSLRGRLPPFPREFSSLSCSRFGSTHCWLFSKSSIISAASGFKLRVKKL